eukprot:GSA25T00017810001.1
MPPPHHQAPPGFAPHQYPHQIYPPGPGPVVHQHPQELLQPQRNPAAREQRGEREHQELHQAEVDKARLQHQEHDNPAQPLQQHVEQRDHSPEDQVEVPPPAPPEHEGLLTSTSSISSVPPPPPLPVPNQENVLRKAKPEIQEGLTAMYGSDVLKDRPGTAASEPATGSITTAGVTPGDSVKPGQADEDGKDEVPFSTNEGKKYTYGNMLIDTGSDDEHAGARPGVSMRHVPPPQASLEQRDREGPGRRDHGHQQNQREGPSHRERHQQEPREQHQRGRGGQHPHDYSTGDDREQEHPRSHREREQHHNQHEQRGQRDQNDRGQQVPPGSATSSTNSSKTAVEQTPGRGKKDDIEWGMTWEESTPRLVATDHRGKQGGKAGKSGKNHKGHKGQKGHREVLEDLPEHGSKGTHHQHVPPHLLAKDQQSFQRLLKQGPSSRSPSPRSEENGKARRQKTRSSSNNLIDTLKRERRDSGAGFFANSGKNTLPEFWEYANDAGKVFGPYTREQMLSFLPKIPKSVAVRRCGDRFFKRLQEWTEFYPGGKSSGGSSSSSGRSSTAASSSAASSSVENEKQHAFDKHKATTNKRAASSSSSANLFQKLQIGCQRALKDPTQPSRVGLKPDETDVAKHMSNYYSALLQSLDLGYFVSVVEEEGQKWEARWINPLSIHFSQRDIHPFFHARGPVEEVIPQVWSEEVSLANGGGRPTGICSWNQQAYWNCPPHLVSTLLQRGAHEHVIVSQNLIANTKAAPLASPVPSARSSVTGTKITNSTCSRNVVQLDQEAPPALGPAPSTGTPPPGGSSHLVLPTVVGSEDPSLLLDHQSLQHMARNWDGERGIPNSVHLLHAPFPNIRVLITEGKLVTIDNRRLYALQRVAVNYWPRRCLVQVLVAPIESIPERKLAKEAPKFTHGAAGKYDGGRWANISSGRTVATASSVTGTGTASTATSDGNSNTNESSGTSASAVASSSSTKTTTTGGGAGGGGGGDQQQPTQVVGTGDTTNWETFDWILEVKKKEALLVLRNLTFPDVGNREIVAHHKGAFSLSPMIALALFRYYTNSFLGLETSSPLCSRVEKDQRSLLDFLHQDPSGRRVAAEMHRSLPPPVRTFRHAFAALATFYYEHFQKPAGIPTSAIGKYDPSPVLDFFGQRWLKRRHQLCDFKIAVSSAGRCFELGAFKALHLKPDQRAKKEDKADLAVWADLCDSADRKSKSEKSTQIRQRTGSLDSIADLQHHFEDVVAGMGKGRLLVHQSGTSEAFPKMDDHQTVASGGAVSDDEDASGTFDDDDLLALVESGYFDSMLKKVIEEGGGLHLQEAQQLQGNDLQLRHANGNVAVEQEQFLDAVFGGCTDAELDEKIAAELEADRAKQNSREAGEQPPDYDNMSDEEELQIGRKYYAPLLPVYEALGKVAELFRVKQFYDVFLNRKWAILQVKLLLHLLTSNFKLQHKSKSSLSSFDNKNSGDLDPNAIFGIHLRDMLYKKRRKGAEIGVRFSKTSR